MTDDDTQEQVAKRDTESKIENQKSVRLELGVLIWLIFVAFGGGILALYYASIGYMPNIAWEESLSYMAVTSIIGGSIVISLIILLFIPGYIWCEFLICDRILKKVLCFSAKEDKDEPCISQITKHLGIPFLVLIVLIHLLLPFAFWIMVVGSGILLSISFWFIGDSFQKALKKIEVDILKSRLYKYSFWFNLSIILSFVSIYFIYQLANKPRPPDYYILAFWCTLIVLSSNFAVAVQFIKYPARALATSLVAAALMLLVANQESTSLSTQLMSKYGFGGKQTITLIVKPEGQEAIKKLGLACADSTYQKFQNVRLLSRLGSEYYLEMKGIRFTLPKEMVISWSVSANTQ